MTLGSFDSLVLALDVPLISMKEIAGRPQDHIDIEYLRKVSDAGK